MRVISDKALNCINFLLLNNNNICKLFIYIEL